MAAADFRITHFIAHIVDHQSGRFELSDLETPIGPDSDFPHQFFQEYIAYSYQHPSRRLATFRDRSTAVVARALAELESGARTFVDVSCDIATHLYDVMLAKKEEYAGPIEIAPGDVMIARFQLEREVEARGGQAPGYLAVMKIHPTEAVLRHLELRDGKRQVVIYESDEGVPAPADDALQKIALAAPVGWLEPQPHDVVILDHQLGFKEVAAFFFSDFLETDLARDPNRDAVFVLETIKDKLSRRPNVVTPPLTAAERIGIVANTVSTLTATPKIKLKDLVDGAVELPERKPQQREKVRKMLVERFAKVPKVAQRLRADQDVTVAVEKVEKLSDTQVYLLDHEVKISGPAEHLDRMLELSEDEDGNTVVTITTRRFDIK
jgi:hypothetical protein